MKSFKSTEKPNKWDWIIFGIVALFIILCFAYWDVFVTTAHTINYIDAISKGHFFDLYKVNYNLIIDGVYTTVCYDIIIYFILMIWYFPLWIFTKIFSLNIINNFFSILWMKGIFVLFIFLCCKVIKKICIELDIKQNLIKWVILFFVSTPMLLTATLLLCQCDIIPIFFMLLGIYYYLKKQDLKFILFFAIAIPMKLFPLLVFIPLLLLREKKISKILLYTLVAVSLLTVLRVGEAMMPLYYESTEGFKVYMFDKLFNSALFETGYGRATIFIALYTLLCIYCYAKNITEAEIKRYVIYIPFLVFLSFLTFVCYHPYWIIYLVPFSSIILFQNAKYFKVNTIVEAFYNLFTLIILSKYSYLCFTAKNVDKMLIPKIFGKRNLTTLKYSYIGALYDKLELSKYFPAVLGISLALAIALAVINFPRKDSDTEEIKVERSLVWLRTSIIIPFAVLLIYCYYVK